MPRIRWTVEEQQIIITEAAQVLLDKKAFSLREAFNVGQGKLPRHRYREIAALSQVPWFTDAVPNKVKELEAEKTNSWESRLAQGIFDARNQERERLEDEYAKITARFFAKVLHYTLDDKDVRDRLFSLFAPPAPPHPAPISRVVKEKRVRVIVAGALNSQARSLEESFGTKLDLRFWSKDQSHDTLRQMLNHADHAVGMISFLPHSADGILKSAKVPYHPVQGGVTHLKSALEKLL